jgi:hypothetical protein
MNSPTGSARELAGIRRPRWMTEPGDRNGKAGGQPAGPGPGVKDIHLIGGRWQTRVLTY